MGIGLFGSQHRQEKHWRDGTHRSRSPAETVADYRRFMKPMGITRLANITGLDCIGLPVYVAVRPNSKLLAVSQGKGVDADSARASALMESIETWHAENVRRPIRMESRRSLQRRASVIEIEGLNRSPARTLADHVPIPWVEGYDVLRQRPVWVPFEAVDLDSVKADEHRPFFLADSNGLASGNHLLEAVVHGLCEVIERDAVSLWFGDEGDESFGKATQLDTSTITDPYSRSILARLAAAELGVGVYDTTSDLGIPTYAAVIFERTRTFRTLGYFWGFGTHLSPAVALSRALSEAVQCRLTEVSGSRDDIFAEEYQHNRDDAELREMARWVYDEPAPLRFDARSDVSSPSFDEDVHLLCEALVGRGLESAVVVDLSHEDVGIPVVKVLVPGLEPTFGPRYVPGRRARALAAARTGSSPPSAVDLGTGRGPR